MASETLTAIQSIKLEVQEIRTMLNSYMDKVDKHEKILIVPPSELVTTDGRGSRRWYTGWGLFSQTDGSKDEKEKKGVGCFPWFVLGVGALVLARQCDPLAAPQEN